MLFALHEVAELCPLVLRGVDPCRVVRAGVQQEHRFILRRLNIREQTCGLRQVSEHENNRSTNQNTRERKSKSLLQPIGGEPRLPASFLSKSRGSTNQCSAHGASIAIKPFGALSIRPPNENLRLKMELGPLRHPNSITGKVNT